MMDPQSMRAVLHYLTPVSWNPGAWSHWVAAAMVAWEVALGLGLLVGERVRAFMWATVGTLGVFTLALVALGLDSSAPVCGCLGAMRREVRVPLDAWIGVARNICLMGALYYAWPHRAIPALRREDSPRAAFAAKRRAFTIVELLVVIVILAALLAIVLPQLGQAKESAERTRSLAFLRESSAALSMYASANKGLLPYLATPGDPLGRLSVRGTPLPRPGYFDGQAQYWINVVYPDYLDAIAPHALPSHLRDATPKEEAFPVLVNMTNTAFAAPKYWADVPSPSGDATVFRAMGIHEVVFPARKGLLVDFSQGFLNPSQGKTPNAVLSALGDGSATAIPVGMLSSDRAVSRPLVSIPGCIMSTLDGFVGVDF